MTPAQSDPTITAVLLHEVKPIQGKLYGFITHSYGQVETETTVHRLASTDDLDVLMVDRFLAVWGELKTVEGDISFYTTSSVLRLLLQEQKTSYRKMRICTLVVGQALRQQWDTAKTSCRGAINNLLDATVRKDKEWRLNRPPHHVIVGTDASKSSSRETGWAFASSDGRLRSGVIDTADIGRGEFHAVTCAIERYQDSNCAVLDILTDSWEVYAMVNHPQQGVCERIKQHAVHCLDAISYARRHGMEVRVHWVRGHNGTILNEFADRAAVSARRCASWELGRAHLRRMENRIRRDLRETIEDSSFDSLLPCFQSHDAVEAAAA